VLFFTTRKHGVNGIPATQCAAGLGYNRVIMGYTRRIRRHAVRPPCLKQSCWYRWTIMRLCYLRPRQPDANILRRPQQFLVEQGVKHPLRLRIQIAYGL